MVEVLHGRGSCGLPFHRWQLLNQFVDFMREDPKVQQNLLERRRILEIVEVEDEIRKVNNGISSE